MRDEIIVLCSNRTKEQIDRAVAYLYDQFPLARDSKLVARETTDADPSYLRGAGWIAVIPSGVDYWGQFTTTIDKMRSAVSDYERGWADAMKYASRPNSVKMGRTK